MMVNGEMTVGFLFVFCYGLSKNKIGSEVRVSVGIHSVLGCTGSYGNQSQ